MSNISWQTILMLAFSWTVSIKYICSQDSLYKINIMHHVIIQKWHINDIVSLLNCNIFGSLCCAMDTWPIVVGYSFDNNCWYSSEFSKICTLIVLSSPWSLLIGGNISSVSTGVAQNSVCFTWHARVVFGKTRNKCHEENNKEFHEQYKVLNKYWLILYHAYF